LKTTVSTWVVSTNGTESLIAIKFVGNMEMDNLVINVLNSYIILLFCVSKRDTRKFCLALVQNVLEMSVWEPYSHSTPRGRLNPQTSEMT